MPRRASSKRKRRVDHGDFPDHHPMAFHIDRFRSEANLVDSAPDRSLLRFAHEGGWDRRYADEVRRAWAEYHGKDKAPEAPQEPQMGLFGSGRGRERESDDGGQGGRPGAQAAIDSSPSPVAPDRGFACDHREIVCVDCGEINPTIIRIPPGDPGCEHRWVQRAIDPEPFGHPEVRRVCDYCSICSMRRPFCSQGRHRDIVEDGDLTYCGACGWQLATIWEDRLWSTRAWIETTIHHPLLSNVSEVVVGEPIEHQGTTVDLERTRWDDEIVRTGEEEILF